MKLPPIKSNSIMIFRQKTLPSTDSFVNFIMAVGDDLTDEDLFKALPENAASIKVGFQASHAKYNIHSYREVRKFIEEVIG
jgi:trehalose 6-phosphate synthase/phosphatase